MGWLLPTGSNETSSPWYGNLQSSGKMGPVIAKFFKIFSTPDFEFVKLVACSSKNSQSNEQKLSRSACSPMGVSDRFITSITGPLSVRSS